MTKYITPLPKYCTQCGAPMIKGLVKTSVSSIDSITGKSNGRKEYKLKCQNIRWWSFAYHDDYLVIDSPNNEITGSPHRTLLTKS